MYYDEYMLLSKDDIEKMKNKLNIVKLLIEDPYAKEKLEEVLSIITNEETSSESVSIDELIYNKMEEAKGNSPELNANLYMLYRKLQDKKIDAVEAMRIYKAYIND